MSDRRSSVSSSCLDGRVRPVRLLAICLASAAVAACTPHVEAGCDVSVTQELDITAVEAPETAVARAIGPSCDKAVGLFAVYDAEGHPAWAWTAPLPRAFGNAFVGADEESMRAFLTRWARPNIGTTSAAPVWDTLSPGQTTLDRLTYDDIRARNLPMLCHAAGAGRELCVFWETAAGSAGHYFEREVEEPTE